MKKILICALACSTLACTKAQQQTFDITTYTAPKNWAKKAADGGLQFSIEDAAKGGYCIITLFKSVPGTDNPKTNFDAAWQDLIKGMVTVSSAPEMQEPARENGWEAQSGYAPFESDGAKGIALLTTATGFGKMINIVILTNTDAYEKDMTAFLESVNFKKPEGGNTSPKNSGNETTNNTIAKKDGYTFSSTNFDNGWTSVATDDYVLAGKGNIKVYLFYIEKFNASDFSGTGLQARNHYWDNHVSKYFVTGEKKFDNRGVLSDFSQDYIEGWATDRQTGEKRYIAMILNIIAYTGTLSVIIASAPDEQQLRRQFPKADGKFENDLLPMYGYNKFAVAKNDLVGKWSSSGGGTMSWYSTTTGDYAGATGAATAQEFLFNSNGSYTSEHKGGYGVVGAMNTYQQKYRGNYTVTDWTVTATNRWDGKTEKFDAWFEIGKGGRMLHLINGSIDMKLFKER